MKPKTLVSVIFYCLVIGLSPLSRANSDDSEFFPVSFLETRLITQTNRSVVLISGQTSGSTRIEVRKIFRWSGILLGKDSMRLELKIDSVIIGSTHSLANSEGKFELRFHLPDPGRYELVLAMEDPNNKKIRHVTLMFDREANAVAMTKRPSAEKLVSTFSRSELSVGFGLTFLDHSHAVPELGTNVKFQNFTGPSPFLGAHLAITPERRLQLEYRLVRGEVKSSEQVAVTNGQFSWSILEADLQSAFAAKPFGESSLLVPFWTLGAQNHSVPVLSETAGTATVRNESLLTLAFGGGARFQTAGPWSYETYLRFQLPATLPKDTIERLFAFDGSLGAVYEWKPRLNVGLYWLGQSHQAKIKSSNFDGTQTLLYSNMETRLSYLF